MRFTGVHVAVIGFVSCMPDTIVVGSSLALHRCRGEEAVAS